MARYFNANKGVIMNKKRQSLMNKIVIWVLIVMLIITVIPTAFVGLFN